MMPDDDIHGYSAELDEELQYILEEYRGGRVSVKQLMRLIDVSCREHLEIRLNVREGESRQED